MQGSSKCLSCGDGLCRVVRVCWSVFGDSGVVSLSYLSPLKVAVTITMLSIHKA